MKKILFLAFWLIPTFIIAQTQGSLTIFSENGDKFFLYLDGLRQNNIAQSNIRVQGLPDLYYSSKIVFEDSAISAVSKSNLYISDGEDILRDAYYRIRREKTGKPKLLFYSMMPVQQNAKAIPGQYVLNFGQPSSEHTIILSEINEAPKEIRQESNALGSLTVFSPNGDKFFLYLNDIKQNETAQADIRIQEIPGPYYNAKIVFKDTRLAPIIKNNLYVADGDDILMDAAYRLRRDKTGKPKLNFYSMKTVQENFIAPVGLFVYSFGKNASGSAVAGTATKTALPVTAVVLPNKQSTAVLAKPPANQTNPAIIPKPPIKTIKSSDSATVKNIPIVTPVKQAEPKEMIPENRKCNGWPMGKGDLVAAKMMIEQAGKDDEKLAAAKDAISASCLLSSQVMEFCNLFKSEKTKLAFAKFAYKYTLDRKNYQEVNKALSLEISKQELAQFINGG